MRFDARAVKTMAPDTHLTFDDFPGLRLQASATRRSWIYRYKSPVNGQMRQKKLGEWPAMSYSAAIAAWEEARAMRASGQDHQRAGRAEPEPDVYTVRRLCHDFLTEYIDRKRSAKGARDVRLRVSAGIEPIADIAAADVTRKHAFDLLSGMVDTPCAARALRSELGAAWDHALDAGRLPDSVPNWWRSVMRGKLKTDGMLREGKRTKAKRVLSDAELTALFGWLPTLDPYLRDALTLYLWTGLRGVEIAAADARHMTDEPDGMWWTIPHIETKNRNRENATAHRIPLVGRAEAIIRSRMQKYKRGPLFPGVEQDDIRCEVYRHQPYSGRSESAGRTPVPVTHWAPHDLRRTARTLLASLGCPREVGEAILGHMVPGVEGVYNLYAFDAEKRVWLTRLADHLESLVR
ncbi:tyrosine-type recombinase/integrase [Burkholderia cenocepacia]|uniref:tyrosine-type recombinase/integrase n=1 Tax=Burkholderia cenocepacia TaxID=95486 RepID=UPI002ABDBD49|nr:integrase family protein [Burkholderia cenocepacia]